jgi:hypothetical protein
VKHPGNTISLTPTRRTFLAGAGIATAGAFLAGCNSDYAVLPSVTAYDDTDILNFALNLEYLEAEFYLRAATGNGLSAADTGNASTTVTGGTKLTGLTTFQQNIVNELAYTEQEHVRFLRSALGSSAVSRPNINLTAGFAGIVTAANAATPATTTLPTIPTAFNPFGTFDQFMVGALAFEDTGVTAYNGAAPLISNAGIAAGYLGAAAGIMAVEAYHGGLLRNLLTANAITQGYTAYPYPLYANRVGVLLNVLSGGTTETSLAGFVAAPATVATVGTSAIVPADSNAIAYHRTTDQVLHIVYGTGGTAGVTSGGFFPNGLNGNISVTQS